jgi:hypothetical protein
MTARWVDKAERKLGWLAVPGFASFLAGMSAVVGVLSLINGAFPARLSLDPELLRAGEAWRAFTFVLVPPQMQPLFLILWLILFYVYLVRLEGVWGDFKLTLYCLLGAAGLVAASLLKDVELSNAIFQTSLFLAFAREFPDFQILLLFVIPVRMKWLALLAWLGVAASLLFGDGAGRLAWSLGLLNYLLFFGGEHWQDAKLALRRRRYARRG